MQSISPAELYQKLSDKEDIMLIDVREPEEHKVFNIGGRLIPLPDIMSHANEIPQDKPVVLYCKMGIRSKIAIQRLSAKYGFTNLINLTGGMEAWKKVFNGL
ncbi:MAG: rhodanese-like domain-containing protein [Sphingobacteriales bacterium]|nr:rhodanese-like domain-containing protein [Sphingobacteriales bacterium]MBI3720517.1 rhodanese-like domain-containing protein [Sphingobacteriales bacterium]